MNTLEYNTDHKIFELLTKWGIKSYPVYVDQNNYSKILLPLLNHCKFSYKTCFYTRIYNILPYTEKLGQQYCSQFCKSSYARTYYIIKLLYKTVCSLCTYTLEYNNVLHTYVMFQFMYVCTVLCKNVSTKFTNICKQFTMVCELFMNLYYVLA